MSGRRERPHDLDQRASALLHAARHDHDATSEQRAAVRKALAEQLAQGSGNMLATKKSVGLSSGKLTLIAGAMALAALSVTYWSLSPSEAPRRSTSVPLAPAPVAVPVERASESLAVSEARIEALEPPGERNAHSLPAPPRTSALKEEKPDAPALRTAASRNERRRAKQAEAVTHESHTSRASRTSRQEPTAQLEHPPEEPQLPPSPLQPSAARVLPSQMAPRSSQAHAPGSVPDRPEAAGELALMQRIQVALNKGDPQQAFTLAKEHEARWPNGSFQQEREAASALASCQLGLPEGADRARRFLARYTRSALAPRVKSECLSSRTFSSE